MIEARATIEARLLGVACVSGIQPAKKASDLIALCRPMALTSFAIEFKAASAGGASAAGIICTATVKTTGPTGVAMDVLTAVQISLLTICGTCKAADRAMVMTDAWVLESGRVGGFRGWRGDSSRSGECLRNRPV